MERDIGEDEARPLRRTRRRRGGPIIAVTLLASTGIARAQQTTPAASPGDRERIVVSFEQRTRVEGLTHPFRRDALGPTRVVALRTRVQVALPRIAGPLGAYLEIQDSRSEWNDQPFVAPARHVNHLDFLQAHLRVDSGPASGGQLSAGMLLGRFTLDVGRRRLVARNGMRNTTNAFDGALGWMQTRRGSRLAVFWSRPVRIEPDSLDRSDRGRLLFGGALTVARWPALTGEVYALRVDEGAKTLTRRRHTTLGGRVFRNPAPGRLSFEAEAAWQDGTIGDLDHGAAFVHLEAGYSLRATRARIDAFYDHVSGDPDPEDGLSRRFDTLFGARRFEYAPTGIYGPFFRGNIEGPGVRATLLPARDLEILVAHRALWLSEARDAWVGSGLDDDTGRSGRSLGHHLEGQVRWRPRHWLLLEATWGHFFKGSYLDRAPGSPRTPDSDYVTAGFAIRHTLLAR